MHACGEVLPGRAVVVPSGHAIHVASVEAPAAVEKKPRGHGMQSSTDVAPVTLCHVPAGHCVQLEDPGDDEYVPGPQGAHIDEAFAAVMAEAVPAGQSKQPLRGWPA